MQVNEATGEVTSSFSGEEFRFHATLPRVAEFQAAIGASGFAALFGLVQEGDVRAIYHGLRALCSSGNGKLFDTMLLGATLAEAGAVILAALSAGLPEPDPGKKEAAGTTVTPSPGAATGK